MIVTNQNVIQKNSTMIVDLAKQALHNIPRHNRYATAYNERGFRDEFRTVRIALPRQSGHSTAALQLMYEYPNSLLFVGDGNSRDCMRGLLRDYTDDYEVLKRIDHCTFISATAPMRDVTPVSDRPFLIFDSVSRMRREAVEEIKTKFESKIILELQ